MRIPPKTLVALVLLALASVVAACGDSSAGGSGSGNLALVAYSTPKEAYEAIILAFAKTPAGAGTTFSQSYGNSGDQARAVIAGLPTDIAALSLEPDISKLVKEHLVAADWNATPTNGIVTRSVVALAVRPGNPKNIKGWDDLVKPGVEVLTPNPFTSDGARWNVMAAYGAQIEQGCTEAQAVAYLKALFEHVVVQDTSAREALQSFTGGKGDVLIRYENEAITARQKGEKLDYVVPDATILVENPIAATTKAGAKAKAFIDYATSEPAQKIFAAKGYRSVIPALVDKQTYPDPPKEFDITKFGGWDAVIAFGLRIRRRPKPEVRERVDELLALVHLTGWADRYPAQLSGGQRQRMPLARALAVQPRVLLLDEPFGALDATVRKELRDWLRKLHDEVHVTTIFVTHDQEEALEVAQQVAVINAGRIEQTGTPDDLYERPANPFVMGFVGPVSRLGETWVRPHDIELLEDEAEGAIEAMIERVARVGFEVRVEVALGDGSPVPVLTTRDRADELELWPGQLVWLRVHREREFAA